MCLKQLYTMDRPKSSNKIITLFFYIHSVRHFEWNICSQYVKRTKDSGVKRSRHIEHC